VSPPADILAEVAPLESPPQTPAIDDNRDDSVISVTDEMVEDEESSGFGSD
jgi:hypothetical protein